MGQCSLGVEQSLIRRETTVWRERQPFESVRCHQQRSLNDRIPWSIPGDAGANPAVVIVFFDKQEVMGNIEVSPSSLFAIVQWPK